jgi:hypothetical protein
MLYSPQFFFCVCQKLRVCSEFLKIVMQTTSDASATYGSVIRDITQQKGIGGLWDGFVPWGMVQAISKGAVFGLVSLSFKPAAAAAERRTTIAALDFVNHYYRITSSSTRNITVPVSHLLCMCACLGIAPYRHTRRHPNSSCPWPTRGQSQWLLR